MFIKTSGPDGPFDIFSDNRLPLVSQPDADCAIAYAQGTLDRAAKRGGEELRSVELYFNYRVGHRADTLSAVQTGSGEYLVGKETITGVASLLSYCRKHSPHHSFLVTIRFNSSHYAFDRGNRRANDIYHEECFR